MNENPEPRPASASRTELAELVMPHLANLSGKLHGGELLCRIDKAAAACAIRHAGTSVVTAAIDEVAFHQPINIAELIRIVATVTYVGRCSMEVQVEVYAEDCKSRTERHTNSCYLTMVSIDGKGQPTPTPPLILENDADRRAFEAGRVRAEARKNRRKK